MKRLIAQELIVKQRLLTENSQEMIIFFDSDMKIIDCNAKALQELGYGEEIYWTTVREIFKKVFIYEDNQFNLNKKYQKQSQETIAYRKNLTCFPVDLRVEIIKEKKLHIGLCTAINISDKKEIIREVNYLKNELNSINQSSNEFIANITHELRTPVNGIMGLSDNLLDTEMKPQQREAVNIIKRCCTNMNSIINDLLDYAKIENDKLILEQREFSFHDFLRHIIDFNKISINEKGLKLLVDVSDDIPDRLIGDEFRLSQILNNLFSNAVKFTSIGQIGLEVTKVSQTDHFLELFFVLVDTGIGIDLDEKDKIFKSFSQVDGSITRRFGGTGLGLSICKKLVESMQGSIAVDSEKNKGSTFSFSVRLGIPQESKEDSFIIDKESYAIDFDESSDTDTDTNTDNTEGYAGISEIDYIRKMLQEANITPLEEISRKEIMKESVIQVAAIIEKLTICIEMENWGKAEEIAYSMKRLIPSDHIEITKNVLRLLLAVRRENHDVSLAILNELKIVLCEVM